MNGLKERHRQLTPLKELKKLEKERIESYENFVAWVIPFLNPNIAKALALGWKMDVGYDFVWMFKGFSRVLLSGGIESDNRKWIHLSISHSNALPHHTTLISVKNLFIGEDITAIQIFPPKEEYVNDMPFCLHLWACLDGIGLPDFRKALPKGRFSI